MSDTSEVYWYGKIFRWLFAMIDKIIYELISFVTDIFNVIAGTEIRTSGIINNFFSRIQLILGIIILFKLIISFFSGIVNPDSLNDQKNGIGSIIKRVVVVLVMLFLIVPLNIPDISVTNLEGSKSNNQKTWNARMNESGILFGTLSELQSRIIRGNIIPKLILGNSSSGEDYNDDIPLTLLKSFIFVNLRPGSDVNHPEDSSNWLCPTKYYENSSEENSDAEAAIKILNGDEVEFYEYEIEEEGADSISTSILRIVSAAGALFPTKENTKIRQGKLITDKKTILEYKRNTLLNSINYKCDLNHPEGAVDSPDGERYIFVYKFFLSTIAGILCLVLLLSLTIDVAIRVFKLLVLRIISPVAILSYIDPKSEKTFNNWVKALTSTYLDLFIRIAIISFMMVLIKMVPELLTWNTYTGDDIGSLAKLFARIILIFGMFFFAKEAPKFITETLGIDSKEGKGIFSGFGKMLGGAVGVLGGISTARTAYKASKLADEINDPNTKHSAKNKAKAIMSGLINGTGATVSTAKTYGKSKDHKWRTAMDKVNAANNYRLQNAAEGGTWWGKTKEQLRQDFTGDSRYAQLKREEKDLKDRQQQYKLQLDEMNARNRRLSERISGLGKLKDYGEEQALKKGARIKDINGVSVNYADWIASFETAKSKGEDLVYKDSFGNKATMTLQEANAMYTKFKEAAGREYLQHSENYNNGVIDGGIVNLQAEADYRIDSNMSAADFEKHFKMARINLINEQAGNSTGGGPNNVPRENSIRGIQETIDSLTTELNAKQKEIATAQANIRGNDGRPGGQ